MITSKSETETEQAGRQLAKSLKPFDIVALKGGMGAGKTAFVRGLAEGLGITARVTSPTFTIVNEYDGVCPLFHFDMFRLESSGELFDIGWDDYAARGGIIVIEWSEIIEDALPREIILVTIEKDVLEENTRHISIEWRK